MAEFATIINDSAIFYVVATTLIWFPFRMVNNFLIHILAAPHAHAVADAVAVPVTLPSISRPCSHRCSRRKCGQHA